jgi:hypothetical protein
VHAADAELNQPPGGLDVQKLTGAAADTKPHHIRPRRRTTKRLIIEKNPESAEQRAKNNDRHVTPM